jgi:hypothetical protein
MKQMGLEAKEPRWKYTALYVIIALLLIGAVGWETASTIAVSKRSSDYLARATRGDTGSCDRVALAMNLNEYQDDLVGVQWRRGLISAVAILLFLPVVSRIELTPAQTVTTGLLIWVVFTSVAGFSDYHMRKEATSTITSCLSLAIPNIADSSNTGDGSGNCSSDIWAPV